MNIKFRRISLFSSVLIAAYFAHLLPGYAQKDPTAKVIHEVSAGDTATPRYRGTKIYSNGDIELKNGKLIKKDGTVYHPDGSVTKRHIKTTGEHKGKKILEGGIIINKDGTREDVCSKSDECKKFRNDNYTNIDGVWKLNNLPKQ